MKQKIITRTVWVLSMVSLFADVASEMLYPVMPVYLKSIGFSVLLIGVLEGMAEATAGLSKGYFGKLSDSKGVRLPFVRWGYLLAAISKPLLALSTYPLWVFGARTLDRLGKGVRTGARDALLSEEATPQTKARVFGLHRSMDTLGAVLGPALALVYLYYAPGQYQPLFFIAFVPGLVAVGLIYLLREKKKPAAPQGSSRYNFLSFMHYWAQSPALYRRLVTGLLLFALFNSSDFFLLLRMKEAGLDDTQVIGVYIFYNLVYALFSYPLGIAADKWGLKKVLLTGIGLFAVVYAGMAVAQHLWLFLVLFFLYGMYAAATEGISKAWITNICAPRDTATAVGTYTAFQSIATLLASSLAGFIWYRYGATAIFGLAAAMAVVVILYLAVAAREFPRESELS
ncbi:MFS transporter [Pontibacter liquoris]|uniref:MFS transporter n=1 Tax=Pontibacter liquoris TaxID=2905677 RepID=UPI001FA78B8E|nr:MFS transporter [Pontibacter liquoris]